PPSGRSASIPSERSLRANHQHRARSRARPRNEATPVSEVEPASAAALIGLLAEEDRLRVVAALVLGAATFDEVVERSGLDVRRATSALERLAAGGLVEGEGGKGLRLVAERFKAAAQAEAKRRAANEPGIEAFEGASAEDAAVLRNFVTDGRLRQIP